MADVYRRNGYRTGTDIFGSDPLHSREVKAMTPADLPVKSKSFEWGRIEYVQTPFQILYCAFDQKDKQLIVDAVDWPIANESNIDGSLELLAQRAEKVLHERSQL